MAEVDVGVGSFSEFPAWVEVSGCGIRKRGRKELPLTYLCFSSSFICSARSCPVPLLDCATSGVPSLEAELEESLERSVEAAFPASPGTTSGEFAMMMADV